MERIKGPFNAIERGVAIGLELDDAGLAVAQLTRDVLALRLRGRKPPFQLFDAP